MSGRHLQSGLWTKTGLLAEGEGFEPPVPFQAQRFSRPPVSTTHPSLRILGKASILFSLQQLCRAPQKRPVAHSLHTHFSNLRIFQIRKWPQKSLGNTPSATSQNHDTAIGFQYSVSIHRKHDFEGEFAVTQWTQREQPSCPRSAARMDMGSREMKDPSMLRAPS